MKNQDSIDFFYCYIFPKLRRAFIMNIENAVLQFKHNNPTVRAFITLGYTSRDFGTYALANKKDRKAFNQSVIKKFSVK